MLGARAPVSSGMTRTATPTPCGTDSVGEPIPMRHEYVGIVEEVGSEVTAYPFLHKLNRYVVR